MPKYDKVTFLYLKMGKTKKQTKGRKKKFKNPREKCSSSSATEEESVGKRYRHKRDSSDEEQNLSSSDDQKRGKTNFHHSKNDTRNKAKGYSSSSEEWVEKKGTDTSSSTSDEESNKKKSIYKRKHTSGVKGNSSSSDDKRVEKKIMAHKRSGNKKESRKQEKDSSSSSEEWVEKKVNNSSSSENESISSRKRKLTPENENQNASASNNIDEVKDRRNEKESISGKREDWLALPTMYLTAPNSDRKRKRDEARKLEREKQQYDPKQCSRELNPYWKDGGDGLPIFRKPNLDDESDGSYSKKGKHDKSSNWRKSDKPKIISDAIKETCIIKNLEKSSTNLDKVNDKESYSEKELNVLAAKLVKAEIMGNTKLVNELKEKLEHARNLQHHVKSTGSQEEEVLLMHTNSYGRTQPLKLQSEYGESSDYHKRKKNMETHKDGQRVRYFADDDKYSLKQMFEKEKYDSVENQNREFANMAGRIRKNDDLDDIFSDNIRKKESDSKIDRRNKERAINEHQKITRSLDGCNKCIQSESMLKHLMVSTKETSYLALPSYEPLTEGHCLIIPIRHVPCATQLDENEWADILDIRKALVRMFMSKNAEVIFFETATSLQRFPHMYVECIPMPKEEGDMAPVYFKKAIDESETEWVHNKKLISLKGRDVRKAVPKGLPYFSVSFGMEEGFAHVIEDEKMFPKNFAQEIIGGMLDVHHSKWRNMKRQSFDEQSKRVIAFSKDWKDFDPT